MLSLQKLVANGAASIKEAQKLQVAAASSLPWPQHQQRRRGETRRYKSTGTQLSTSFNSKLSIKTNLSKALRLEAPYCLANAAKGSLDSGLSL